MHHRFTSKLRSSAAPTTRKLAWLRLILALQLVVSGFYLPSPAMAQSKDVTAENARASKVENGKGGGEAVTDNFWAETNVHSDAANNAEGRDKVKDHTKIASKDAPNDQQDATKDGAAAQQAQTDPDKKSLPASLTAKRAITAVERVPAELVPTANNGTASKQVAAKVEGTNAELVPTANNGTTTQPVAAKVEGLSAEQVPIANNGTTIKQGAAKVEGLSAEQVPIANNQTSPDEGVSNKEGIGGFVGSSGGELALLEQGFVQTNVRETLGEVIIVDNDEAMEVEDTIAYEELPTDDGKTKIKSGAQFPVVMSSQLTSKTSKKGDSIQARLKYDLKIGDRLVAEKGARVLGHIDYCLPARSALHSIVSPHRWYRNSGCLGITFDEIVNKQGEHIALNAKPARKARIIKNKGEGRLLGVNHDGQIAGPLSQQLRYKAVRAGLNFALAPAGVFSFGAMPVALGVIGAVNPSFAFMKPVGLNVRHRRIKGFAWGFLSGVPGSWIIEDTVTKGQEAIIKPGDEFLVELQQEFTGEARSEAELLPGSRAKVRGQVLKDPNAKKGKAAKSAKPANKPALKN